MSAGETRAEKRAAGPVRITLPAKVAYDPKALKETIVSVMERLGCPRCFSGADCLFQSERDFVINPQRGLESGGAFAAATVSADPAAVATHRFTVGLSRGVKYDIGKVEQAVDKVIDLIGAHPCISGFDFLFQDELRVITVNEQLQAQRFGQEF